MDALAAGALPQGAPYALDTKDNRIGPRRRLSAADWDALIGVMKERRIPALDANGLMTDEALARIAALDFVTSLSLGGSRELTDEGLLHLARMPQLEQRIGRERPCRSLRSRTGSRASGASLPLHRPSAPGLGASVTAARWPVDVPPQAPLAEWNDARHL
jgi:hypothetical protein